jgi:adenylylsulfate kinase
VKFKETKKRSIIKSVTFRIAVILADLVVIYILTRRIDTTITLTVLTNIASTILYFIHERAWDGVSWGRLRIK